MIVTDKKVLRWKSEPVTDNEDIAVIVDQIKEAVKTAWTPGCGLAAIQIGILKRVAWLKVDSKELVLINPEIIYCGSGKLVEKEGCLSIPGIRTMVQRNFLIEVITNGRTGKKETFTGFLARVIQHEIDHMDGILNIDKKFSPGSRNKTKSKLQKKSRKKNRKK